MAVSLVRWFLNDTNTGGNKGKGKNGKKCSKCGGEGYEEKDCFVCHPEKKKAWEKKKAEFKKAKEDKKKDKARVPHGYQTNYNIFEIVRFSECSIRLLKPKKEVEIDFTAIGGATSEKKYADILYLLIGCCSTAALEDRLLQPYPTDSSPQPKRPTNAHNPIPHGGSRTSFFNFSFLDRQIPALSRIQTNLRKFPSHLLSVAPPALSRSYLSCLSSHCSSLLTSRKL